MSILRYPRHILGKYFRNCTNSAFECNILKEYKIHIPFPNSQPSLFLNKDNIYELETWFESPP